MLQYLDPTAQLLDPQLSVFLRPDMIRIGAYSRIDAFCKIEGGDGVVIGDHVHIASFGHIGAGGGQVEIGDHSGTASHVVICSGMPDLRYWHICAADFGHLQHPQRLRTVIGRHVVIFAGAVICPGVTIHDGAVVGAGAVITRDIPALEVWAGVPAKRVARRHLEALQEFVMQEEIPAL